MDLNLALLYFFQKIKMTGGHHPHSQSQPKGHGGRTVMTLVDKFYEHTPGFQDLFDEESFYIFATVFTLATCLAAFVASRYITLKSRD